MSTWSEVAPGGPDVLVVDTEHITAVDTDIRRLVDVDDLTGPRSFYRVIVDSIAEVESDLEHHPRHYSELDCMDNPSLMDTDTAFVAVK